MAKSKGRGGFPSIFRNKAGGSRYQGTLTKVGSKKFEAARARLSQLANQKATDADVMEFLALDRRSVADHLKLPLDHPFRGEPK